jgi:hypothetical protein
MAPLGVMPEERASSMTSRVVGIVGLKFAAILHLKIKFSVRRPAHVLSRPLRRSGQSSDTVLQESSDT